MCSIRFFALAFTCLMSVAATSFAGPGAHGPDGEHLGPSGVVSAAQTAQPRFEAATELFELVAVLAGSELSILIDRFESNAPVLGARVEVEAAGRKSVAKFHADHGDYAIDDPALVTALSKPGEHAVVIAIVVGDDSDLLNGTLVVAGSGARASLPGHDHDQDHDHAFERAAWIAFGVAALAAAMVLLWRRRQRREPSAQRRAA